jgi:predicted methyltransferase MtxX (methanogen marker protein 4)
MMMNQQKTTLEPILLKLAQHRRIRVAIGILRPTDKIIAYLEKARQFCDPVLVGQEVQGFESIVSDQPHETLFKLLKENNVDAIIRGQGPSEPFRDSFNIYYDHEVNPGDAFVGVVEDMDGRPFMLSPITNGRGWNNDDKKLLINASAKLLTKLGIPVKIAVLCFGREEDLSRVKEFIKKSFFEANELVDFFQEKYDIKNYGIDFEIALAENATIIIEPNGGTGNQVVRSLVFLDAIRNYGVPILNADRVIIESMRHSEDFSDHFLLAAALVNSTP